ncbi:hypothetical protein [Leifsonia sp. C5G2]|uniref:hypothetical protein n=1 Tax=Leifsonia sp. C5G2 TaxID=2735269 RepID=UPI001C30B3EC|nr:hypothetical protein [Leifsonia sp. C5G2]
MRETRERTGRLEFQHRPSGSALIERVWRSRSRDIATMTSVARAHWDFVFWEGPDGRWFHLGGERILIPGYADAEAFVALLVRKGLLWLRWA